MLVNSGPDDAYEWDKCVGGLWKGVKTIMIHVKHLFVGGQVILKLRESEIPGNHSHGDGRADCDRKSGAVAAV